MTKFNFNRNKKTGKKKLSEKKSNDGIFIRLKIFYRCGNITELTILAEDCRFDFQLISF